VVVWIQGGGIPQSFQTIIGDFPYTISDLSEKATPHFSLLKLVHGSNMTAAT